ncbi:MAG: S26 family signal peptidase [Actinobacteria bacterium]|nr:S26 family signal peptidase [Actinomycetota bacterium]
MAVVSGLSMIPTLAPGERLLVRHDGPMVLGDLVIFKRDNQYDIKRLIRIETDGIFAQGDNDLVSTDSRTYGLIPHDNVIGVATYRLWPKPGRIKG